MAKHRSAARDNRFAAAFLRDQPYAIGAVRSVVLDGLRNAVLKGN
jgi:hypothetical protein